MPLHHRWTLVCFYAKDSTDYLVAATKEIKQSNSSSAHKPCVVLCFTNVGSNYCSLRNFLCPTKGTYRHWLRISPNRTCEPLFRGWLLLSQPSKVIGFDTKPIYGQKFYILTNGYNKQLLSYGSFPNYDFPFANATGGGIAIGRIFVVPMLGFEPRTV